MLAKFSVKRPYTVFVGIATAILLGVMAFINMTTDLLPKMDLPYVVVYTTYVGASPEEIENTVSKPMEAEFSTVSGLANISSSSSENLSLIIMEYESETNMDSVMLDLNAKIDALKSSFPEAVGIPVMMKINPEMLPIMIAAVDLKDADIKQLSAFTKDSLVPALEGVEGVGSVTASGLIEEDITVTLREEMVDDLNSKILREIDSELADVEQQLNDAEKELDDAEKQLNSKSKKGMKQIKDGLSQLEQAREAIPGMIAACEEQLASLRQQKREAEAGLEQINSALAQTPESMPPEAAGALSAMRRQLASLRQQLSAKQAELEALEGAQATNPPATNPPATNPPQATDAPTTTQPPQPTDTPATTQPPQATNPPAASQPPQATDAPATTQSPQATDAPGIAPYDADGESEQETPAPTEQPQSTDAPAATQQPQATEAPAATQLPQATQPPEDPPHGAGSPDGSGEQGMFSPLSAFASLFSARAESDAEKIAALRAEIAQLQAQISAIENSPEYRQLAALEGAVAQRPALVEQKAQLENAIPQLDGGIAKLEGMIEKLNNGIIPAGLIDGIDKDTDIEDA
ncbi:MAG: efflux RND transporter permease subunit [Christensenellales bacterium]|jgi:predicted  nucleic acid-binding Zn-ribbon protein